MIITLLAAQDSIAIRTIDRMSLILYVKDAGLFEYA